MNNGLLLGMFVIGMLLALGSPNPAAPLWAKIGQIAGLLLIGVVFIVATWEA
jgi:hypothetical protein